MGKQVSLSPNPVQPGLEITNGSILGIIDGVGQCLRERAIPHCLWKGAGRVERWGTGLGDIDLLVAADAHKPLIDVLTAFAFREASAPWLTTDGVSHFYGVDPDTGKLVHIHLYTQLILGRPWQSQFRLPVEALLLESSRPGPVFAMPGRVLADLVRVLDVVAKMGVRGTLAGSGRARIASHASAEVTARAASSGLRIDPSDIELFCRAAGPDSTLRQRIAAKVRLRSILRHHYRPPRWRSRLVAVASSLGLPRALRDRVQGKHLRERGRVIALIGGDGAGKSTAAEALRRWLGPELSVAHIHVGRPPRSWLTLMIGALLKGAAVGRGRGANGSQPTGLLTGLRTLMTARDRWRLTRRARRWADRGTLVIAERYPVEGNQALVGPSVPAVLSPRAAATWLGRTMVRVEAGLYDRIPPPDLTFLLRVDPQVAVERKTTEPADYVQARNTAISSVDWTSKSVVVVDANRPQAEVHLDLKRLIWAAL